jgi:acetyl esterase/lipase
MLPAFAADASPPKLPLWADGAPNALKDGGEEAVRVTAQGERVVSNVHRPSITVYLPAGKSPRPAVIVIPGGGHRELWTDHEGHAVAKFLNQQGVAAFVLFYRLARAPGSQYTIEGDALNDLKRAIRTVRSRAPEWNVAPEKIGVIGFSAGGQLAALGASRFDVGDAAASDPIEHVSSRPDFAGLVYAGTFPDLQPDATTPPMFILAGGADRADVLVASVQRYQKLREANVPAELHLYDGVPHGFGLRASNTGPITQWPSQFVDWLRVRKIL